MHKEELVFLHLTLFHMKRFFEEAGIANGHFASYDKLGIQPVHIHKSKAEHKKAILTLCKGITDIFKESQPEDVVKNPRVREMLEVVCSVAQH
ncbi:putative metal-binding protein [Archaeoglobus sulfaticallidus PM70-1]|uniref:Putative metal-binding protein n=1 Tax=Archaeoglobus sulfaticallidus PM70-1 TaxID=387631 RepID=N0BIX5_9EURY|nr:UPF0058 family protein [Archaeoglobus sulfaticallidus]AGK60100.1 putative metal-binding protein [Archaeoglobus sulfaticallidus PM70-1]